MKKCTKCGLQKDESEFYAKKTGRDGLTARCKECIRNDVAAYQNTEHGKKVKHAYNHSEAGKAAFRKHDRKRDKTEYRKQQKNQAGKKHRLKYEDRRKARQAVKDAVKHGKIPRVKTLTCSMCQAKPAEQYHHYLGYSKEHKLDIIPLCRTCHREVENT